MATSIFYRVIEQASGFDLTEYITRFSFEDCTDQDDQLKLTLENIGVEMRDNKHLKKGKTLLFSWGYIGGPQSKQHQAIITAIEPDYGAKFTMSVVAADSGIVLKKDNSPTLHQGKTAAQIARETAKKHGLKVNIEETAKVYKSMPSGGRTDYELLKYLAAHEPGGRFRFMVKGDTLHFTRINLRKSSQRTFRWNDGSGVVLSFRPRDNDSRKKSSSAATLVPGMDPYTGKGHAGKAEEGKTKDDPKLGNYNVHYDADGKEVFRDKPPVSRTVVAPAHDSAAADAIASKEKKDSSLKDITASLTILGDPNLEADGIISVAGVAPSDGGNWYLTKITHTLQGGSYYQCLCDLGRNATNAAPKAGAAKNADKNSSDGPDKTASTREVRVKYDENSNRVK